MPMGGAQIVFLLLAVAVSTYIPHTRILMMMVNCAASMVGMILIWKLPDSNLAGRMVGISIGAVFGANIPLSLSLVSSNVAGFTKRSVVSALLFVAYCVGNIVGPQFFLASEDPAYPVGYPSFINGDRTNDCRLGSKRQCLAWCWACSFLSFLSSITFVRISVETVYMGCPQK